MKLRNSRGPNCDEASCKATIMIENVTLAIVIIEAATVESKAREPSGPRVNVQPSVANHLSLAAVLSRWIIPSDITTAAATMNVGTNQ